MLSVWRLSNWAAEKALTLRNRAQHDLLESHLGQGTGSTCHLPGPFWRPPFLKPQHNVANFVSLPLFSTYLFWPADLPEKYTLSAPLPSLQNKRGKTLSSDPSPRQSLCWDVGRKDKAFAWGPHYWQMLSATNKQVTGSVATRKDLSKERRVDVLHKPQ